MTKYLMRTLNIPSGMLSEAVVKYQRVSGEKHRRDTGESSVVLPEIPQKPALKWLNN